MQRDIKRNSITNPVWDVASQTDTVVGK